MSDDLNWKEWFEAWGDQNSLHVACRVGPGGLRTTPEEMYQAFKARLIAEQQCQTCDGNGMIGGFVNTENGYDSEPCPDCSPVEQQEPAYQSGDQLFWIGRGPIAPVPPKVTITGLQPNTEYELEAYLHEPSELSAKLTPK